MDVVKRISTTDDVDKLSHLYNVPDSKYATDNAGNTCIIRFLSYLFKVYTHC